MIKSDEFSDLEFRNILAYTHNLLRHGYFTGINFIKSNEKLPDESIIIHFLHESKKHLEEIVQEIRPPYQITPRFTLYAFDSKYKNKLDFKEQYKDAIFYDQYSSIISLEEVIKKDSIELNVAREELDLIIPCQDTDLRETISNIQKANMEGPYPWRDPVIIIKTKQLIETVPNFKNNMYYISITRDKEEFYTIVHNDSIALSLKKYIKNLCEKVKIGNLDGNSVKFHLSQINIEFYNYIIRNLQQPFEAL